MISNRSFSVILFAFISAVVLLITARRLDQWDSNGGHYHTGELSPHVAVGTNVTATAPLESTDAIPMSAPASNQGQNQAFAANHGLQSLRPDRDPICDGFPDTSGILLIMKTGATESFDKLPTQLITILRCLPDFLLFSDLDQHIAGYHVRDSLETVLSTAKDGNADFDLYRQQKDCVIDQEMCAKNLEGAQGAGWNLDKYKNIHMAEKAHRLRPGYDWYFFVDADTYVSWPNLVQMLRKLDPTKPRYLGSPTLIRGYPFAHGGSGYVLSGAAMKEFAGQNPGIANKYDAQIKDVCCGDYMFAISLNDTVGLMVESLWPLINGEKPSTFPFGSRHWCNPIATMHHMSSEEVSAFWEFERQRYTRTQEPLLLKEVYYEYFEPKLVPVREDWDNQSDNLYYIDLDSPDHTWEDWRITRAPREEDKSELEKLAHLSADDCARACDEHNDCMQYSYKNDCCGMKGSFQLGKPVKRPQEEKERMTSGWAVAKIERWIEQQGDCEDVSWPEVKP
ncbi:glycosyltransferase family 31 protein [Diaporthe amygdali]|uniref:glycosyltransferase family 31 protein n=1 Tax=Phomopsis amygdali TaxID=1214568 RepID=UPI0022FDCAD3|nr:glycosyltransferase family 31 protein [Diaporthe amygdali]KAJ0125242.1 glycosyltransferase family 31 protein [Diaporthe amygdali]